MDYIQGQRYDLTVTKAGSKTAFAQIDGGHGAVAILRSCTSMYIEFADLEVGTRLRASLEPTKRIGMFLAQAVRLKSIPTRKVAPCPTHTEQ